MRAINSWISLHILYHIPVVHPFGNRAKLRQPMCNTLNVKNVLVRQTLNVENVFVSYSPTDDSILAVFLRKRHK